MIQHRCSTTIPPLLFFGLGALFLACPQAAKSGFDSGLALCVHSLAPALFPFFVVSSLVVASPGSETLGLPLRPLCRIFRLKSEAAPLALLLSWLGGYTVCMQVLAQYRAGGRLSAKEADLLAMLGFCSGPGFVVGCVGGILLGSPRFGFALYTMQLLANLPAAALLAPLAGRGRGGGKTEETPCAPGGGADLAEAINGSVSALLSVCGCVIFFSAVCALLHRLLPLGSASAPFLSALFEVTSGCAAFVQAGGAYACYGLGLCLSLPGLSVLCQLMVLCKGQVSLRLLALSRGLHMAFLQLLLAVWMRLNPGTAPVFSSLNKRVIVLHRGAPDTVFLLFVFLCTVLYKASKTQYNKR